jgi:hypothetical protein
MPSRLLLAVAALIATTTIQPASAAGENAAYARDPAQPIDDAYTAKIREFTTDPSFSTPLTDYLPAAPGVPTPRETLGYIAGAPDRLPYSAEVYRYFRDLEKASPRVRVFSIGKTEEGREMIAVAIADEKLLADREANGARLAQLADPRTIGMNDAKAAELVAASHPVYYITGTIHSTETGAPTALMELAYRLAVDDAPYIRKIRSNVITLITPIVEVDGRDRMVDLYNWHKAHPDENYPRLIYWGHYVAHDNNRDAMGMTLALTRNVLDTYLDWHAQVLHDLHESVPFLYDNTVGDGPYNAWLDPILVNEWQEIGWNNVQRMTKLGMPGVFTHGDFDTWSPGYLMFLAATHNGISRLYETFGNDGADTVERILEPDEYARTWYRPNPPLPKVTWSQRNNNNYEQTGLLTALDYFADHGKTFLDGFYRKSKRSIEKPTAAGPAAYVIPADDAHRGARSRLLKVLERQHVEMSRLDGPAEVMVDAPKKDEDDKSAKKEDSAKDAKPAKTPRTFAAGSVVVRMDQPFSRVADALLDRQYWAPNDPQKHPYDDTGWTMGPLFGVDVVRVTDNAILKAPMSRIDKSVDVAAGLASIDVPPGKLPRIALMHTWIETQTEGWWRMALDDLGVKYDYISTQDVARIGNLRSKYDVILFAPVHGASTELIVDGMPMWGNAMPWKTTKLTPNLGRIDETDDVRPGLGAEGVARLRKFVEDGGLLVASENTARFAIDLGLAPGVSFVESDKVKVVGSVLAAKLVDRASPIARGYGEDVALYSANGEFFKISDLARGGNDLPNRKDYKRPTGRGGPDDVDMPEGRAPVEPYPLPDPKPWQATPLNAEQQRNNPYVIPENLRPRVIARWAASKDLLISGLLDGGSEMAERPAVVDARYGKGHVLLFANNPIWRGETIGSWPLVFNAVVNFDRLDSPAAAKR